MPSWRSQPWRRDSNETASEEPGAVHSIRKARWPEGLGNLRRDPSIQDIAVFDSRP
jgi:hypothetical protein